MWGGISVVGVLLLLVTGFHEPILLEAGRFMAPVDDPVEQVADVIILEGTEHIQKEILARATSMLSAGKAKRIAIVLSQPTTEERSSGSSEDNSSKPRKELESMGLNENTSKVIITPDRHPITLTSAQAAIEVLAGGDVKNAILISPGFHMRRSYLVYQHLGEPLQIRIYPHASFDGHDHGLDNWWTQRHGVYDFVEQVLKLAYYMIKGYIPLKFSY